MSQQPGDFDPMDMDGGFTTFAVGEEGDDPGDRATTMAVGEEGDDDPTDLRDAGVDEATTMAVGEEGDDEATTFALGEEGDDEPRDELTTQAIGEEGDDPFAEQDLGLEDSMDEFNQAADDLGSFGGDGFEGPDTGDWGDLAL